MNLYEIIRWGNDSDCPFTGGPNGPDTCFLVRADTVEAAAGLADRELARMPSTQVRDWAGAVYLLGADGGTDATPRVLRGPYIQSAYCYGWRQWQRETQDGQWTEVPR